MPADHAAQLRGAWSLALKAVAMRGQGAARRQATPFSKEK